MATSNYPKTLHHPRVAGVVATVETEQQEKDWREQGWLVNPPKASETVPVGERVTDTK
ncbi:hypothetical protein [Kocuria carniphila]